MFLVCCSSFYKCLPWLSLPFCLTGDNTVQPEQVRKVILCSGKHYYNLAEERQKRQANDTAIIRLESLCPFPVQELQAQLAQYGNVQCKFAS